VYNIAGVGFFMCQIWSMWILQSQTTGQENEQGVNLDGKA